jgi:DNA-binding response OmpR family regulator
MRILLAEDEKKVADIIVRGLKAERYAVDARLPPPKSAAH